MPIHGLDLLFLNRYSKTTKILPIQTNPKELKINICIANMTKPQKQTQSDLLDSTFSQRQYRPKSKQ